MVNAMPTHPTLLLIHGLGATSGAWAELEAELEWPGRVVVPDLPGHGLSAWTGDYTLGTLAGALSPDFELDEPVVVVGHSLGGAVGLCLASGLFRPRVEAVVGIGIKVTWSDEDIINMKKVAERGVRYFDTREDAVDRFLRQAGLADLVEPDHRSARTGVVEDHDKWRLSQDPLTFAQKPVDMAGLMAAARCPVVLGAGEHDAMVTAADLSAYVSDERIAAGRGHNVQVEDPAWVATLVQDVTAPLL